MAAMASHLLLSRSNHHSRGTALKLKTGFEAGRHDSGRAKAIRAADWRNPASSSSLSGSSRAKDRSSEAEGEQGTSSVFSSPVLINLEDLNGEPARYRRPKSVEVPWQMISSAPVKSRTPQADLFDYCLVNATDVEFKDAKPVVVNINGEQVVLPNQFTFDITPVYLSEESPENSVRGSIGQLKRVRDHKQLRTKSFQGSNLFDELPNDIKDLLTHDSKGTPEREQPRRKTSETAPSESWIQVKEYPQHECSTLKEADKQRFESLLERLNSMRKKEEPQSHSGQLPMSVFDVRSSDPAILAAKVKEGKVTVRSPQRNEIQTKSVEPPCVSKPLNSGYSHDSGYATGFNLPSANNPHASNQSSTHSDVTGHKDNTKKLNPAAAEFKFGGETVRMPFLVPKRLFRPPLTDGLFDAPGMVPSQPVSTPIRPPPGFGPAPSGPVAPQAQVPRQPELGSNGNAQPAPVAAPIIPHPQPLGNSDPKTSQASPLTGLFPEQLPGAFPPVNLFPRPLNMNSTVPYSTMMPTISGPPPNFGTAPPGPFNPFPMLGAQMGLPNMNPFGTFPTPDITLPGVPLPPPFTRNQTLPGPSGLAALSASVLPLQAVGPDGKVVRPHFPVTQKPRDHDPVKQQQYEAYLEWRKANEPGYHIKCKMRQANRIVRQYQMKQAGLNEKGATKAGDTTEHPAWKSIVEKAKAVVANAAAAAAAEKKSRGESVREEFKAKIRESCSGLLKTSQQIPANQAAESSKTEEKKESLEGPDDKVGIQIAAS